MTFSFNALKWCRTFAVGSLFAVGAGACANSTDISSGAAGTGPGATSTSSSSSSGQTNHVQRLTSRGVASADILLAIDNSRSMADKQHILSAAIPDLVGRLVNPRCIDGKGNPIPSDQQATLSPTDACPKGTAREFSPLLDVHIGIVSSSLGDHGANSGCPDMRPDDLGDCGGKPYSNNDYGHLITRTDPCTDAQAMTYANQGFLAWDPAGAKTPPGDSNLPHFEQTFQSLVIGTGQIGCGFESQNESWYRFLVDPAPYAKIAVVNNVATKTGTDQTLLAERMNFLRDDSLLAVILLTDEDDCSAIEGGGYWALESNANHLPPARSECAKNPNDPCCANCTTSLPNCPADPACSKPLDDSTDNFNLRCFDNKRKFGIDFLYPTKRYVNALTNQFINTDRPDLALMNGGKMTPNPLFAGGRDPGLVVFAGIVGVPWQDIARDPTDPTKGYKNATELAKADAKSNLTTWDVILGDPENNVPPADPHMRESIDPRSGMNPITGTSIAPPSSAPGADPINGHEYTIADRSDLQYACIFPLPQSRDCSKGLTSCDCGLQPDNPLCDTANPNLQVRAKGYPGLRHLEILKGVGDQGVVASICPSNLADETKDDYGYRPAIGAIVDRLKTKLGAQCLPVALHAGADGSVSCSLIEARKVATGDCTCDAKAGRAFVPIADGLAIPEIKNDPTFAQAQWNCFCEIPQATGETLSVCQNDTRSVPTLSDKSYANGWCYVDATTTPPIGNKDLVATCSMDEQREIRFLGTGIPVPGATSFLYCTN